MLRRQVPRCLSICFELHTKSCPCPAMRLLCFALQAERRSLLDRVQQLSAEEADASARVERLVMENDALNAELERSQEVCREMLAARRAARDALSEMSAQVRPPLGYRPVL